MISKSRELAAQRAYSATLGRGARSLAVTGSQPDAGSCGLAEDIAAAGAAFGKRVLLVRARLRHSGEPMGEDIATSTEAIWKACRTAGNMLWTIDVPAGTELHALLNDGQRLALAVADWLERFDAVVFDCPPFETVQPAIYTPLTASAAEAVVLVTLPGTVPRAGMEEVLKWLTESGAVVSALVLNDRLNPTLAQEMIREARRFQRFLPRLVAWMTRKVEGWAALNMHH